MRITVVSSGDVSRDPAAPPLVHSLAAAGHDVSIVAANGDMVADRPVTVPQLPTPSRRLGRSKPPDRAAVLGKAINRLKPDVIHPLRRRDLPAALASKRGLIARGVGWELPNDRDLIDQAPAHPSASQPANPSDLGLYEPGERRAASSPAAGRHTGRSLALVYRRSGTSPGRYLAAAAERSGVDVIRFDGRLDWSDVPSNCSAVIFVESPYPAMPITGTNPGIPVLFWVHHGEHHLNASLRLAGRYQADAVLLAHSWHLAHRFSVPVHRFPFAVAPELYTEEVPSFAQRTVDVAMVGAGVETESTSYQTRWTRVNDLRSEFPGRVLFKSDLPPEAMAAIYANAKVVINDGGARHYPITMRVFEAIGAGALLATDHAPGLDLLFQTPVHFAELSWTVPAHIRELLDNPATEQRAIDAHDHATRFHTYDHRIDDLFSIAAVTTHTARGESTLRSALDRIIDTDVEVSTLVVFGDIDIDLKDREVRNGASWLEADGSGRFDAAAVAIGSADLTKVAAAVRRYIYILGGNEARDLAEVQSVRRNAAAVTIGNVVRVDVGAPGYIVRAGSPL